MQVEQDIYNTEFSPSSKLNFVIGICAFLISIASFYATYLQANSAEQQVKAMTYPLIQYRTGNYSVELDESAINLSISNAGVGPATIKTVKYKYQDKYYSNLYEFLAACCNPQYSEFASPTHKSKSNIESQFLTSFAENSILPAGDNVMLAQLRKRAENIELWSVLNEKRFELDFQVCYCSLLDQCYVTEGVGKIDEVDSCSEDES